MQVVASKFSIKIKILYYTDNATYLKNKNKIFTQGNSRAIDLVDNMIIQANDFEYNKINITTIDKKTKFTK